MEFSVPAEVRHCNGQVRVGLYSPYSKTIQLAHRPRSQDEGDVLKKDFGQQNAQPK